MVATASMDSTARLWDAKTGLELAVLRHNEHSEVKTAEFSPDGSRTVTASDDYTARLWDTMTGSLLAILRGHECSVMTATFNPDGTQVVTASVDKTARLWDASTVGFAVTLSAARASALQPMTKQERIQFFLSNQTEEHTPLHMDNSDSSQAQRLWDGDDIPQDRQAAHRLWQQSADSGDPWSHERLGWIYEIGREGVVPQDLEQALFHYAVATRLFELAGMEEEAAKTMARRGTLARSLPMEVAARVWDAAMA